MVILRRPLIVSLRLPPSSDRRTPQSGQRRSRGHRPRCHRHSQHPRHHFPCQPLQSHPRFPCQQHPLRTSVTPLAAGVRCPTTTRHPRNCIQLVTLWACGHPISRTTRVHMVTATRTPKRLNLTSSLVGTCINYAHSYLAVSWPSIVGHVSLRLTDRECLTQRRTSLTSPCCGGNRFWSHFQNCPFATIGVSLSIS